MRKHFTKIKKNGRVWLISEEIDEQYEQEQEKSRQELEFQNQQEEEFQSLRDELADEDMNSTWNDSLNLSLSINR